MIPPELQADLTALTHQWRDTPLEQWLTLLPEQIKQGLSLERYGDLPHWRDAIATLPTLTPSRVFIDKAIVGCNGAIAPKTRKQLEAALYRLHPWRKGPFELFGVHIDTEWRSDWKWERVLPGLNNLTGQRVLDVGCGSGYHCWRMLGAGATEVIGIEPKPLFLLQFKAIQHYLQQPGIHVLPVTMEQLPPSLRAFDTVFSMGVLYHRRSPINHLQELRDALRPGGQLVLETLVVEGDEQTVFVPPGRYACMNNVWSLPSTKALCLWLEKAGLCAPKVINISITSTEEQRTTDWMTFHSLDKFLDPEDPSRSIEGHPAPKRAIIISYAP